jgi:hypothetical protein
MGQWGRASAVGMDKANWAGCSHTAAIRVADAVPFGAVGTVRAKRSRDPSVLHAKTGGMLYITGT